MDANTVEVSVKTHYIVCSAVSEILGEFPTKESLESRQEEVYQKFFESYKELFVDTHEIEPVIVGIAWHDEAEKPALISLVEPAVLIGKGRQNEAVGLIKIFVNDLKSKGETTLFGVVILTDSWVSIRSTEDLEALKSLRPSEDPFREEAIVASYLTEKEDTVINQIYTRSKVGDDDTIEWGRIEKNKNHGGKFSRLF